MASGTQVSTMKKLSTLMLIILMVVALNFMFVVGSINPDSEAAKPGEKVLIPHEVLKKMADNYPALEYEVKRFLSETSSSEEKKSDNLVNDDKVEVHHSLSKPAPHG